LFGRRAAACAAGSTRHCRRPAGNSQSTPLRVCVSSNTSARGLGVSEALSTLGWPAAAWPCSSLKLPALLLAQAELRLLRPPPVLLLRCSFCWYSLTCVGGACIRRRLGG
jgi:hypothetical protein